MGPTMGPAEEAGATGRSVRRWPVWVLKNEKAFPELFKKEEGQIESQQGVRDKQQLMRLELG